MQPYIIAKKNQLTNDSVLITLKPKYAQEAFDFYPGQYLSLSFMRHARPSAMRCFSIVNSPYQRDELQIAVKIEGAFTKALTSLATGTTVKIRGPFGNFVLDSEIRQPVIMMAGGIGITPFMSMIRTAVAEKDPTRMILLYSNPSLKEAAFVEELNDLQKKHSKFTVVYFVTQHHDAKANGAKVISGRINYQMIANLVANDFNRCQYYICGSSAFYRGMLSILNEGDTDPYQIVSESFALGGGIKEMTIPRERPARLVYSLTAFLLLAGTGTIGLMDLVRFMPKVSAATQNQQQNAAAQAPSTSSASSLNQSPSASSTTNSGSNSSTTSTPSYTTYQAPVTSIS